MRYKTWMWTWTVAMSLAIPALLAAEVSARCPGCGNDIQFENTPEGAFLKMRTGYLNQDLKLLVEAVSGVSAPTLKEFLAARPSKDFEELVLARGPAARVDGDTAVVSVRLPGAGAGTIEAVREQGTWKVKLPMGALSLMNENSAKAALKQLVSTQGVWRMTDSDRNGAQDYWTGDVAGFYYMTDASKAPLKYIDISMALADRGNVEKYSKEMPSAQKSGYWLRVLRLDVEGNPYSQDADEDGTANTNPSKYGFCAYPAEYGVGGLKTYIVNEEGVIYEKDLGPESKDGVERWPAEDPTTQGWFASE